MVTESIRAGAGSLGPQGGKSEGFLHWCHPHATFLGYKWSERPGLGLIRHRRGVFGELWGGGCSRGAVAVLAVRH